MSRPAGKYGSKRGRPRSNRPEVDLGTPELRMKRLAALGAPRGPTGRRPIPRRPKTPSG